MKRFVFVCLLISMTASANQQTGGLSLASSLLNPFTVGLAAGAVFTAGTVLWLRAQAEITFLHRTVVGRIHIEDDVHDLENILADLEYFVGSSKFFAILLSINAAGGQFGTAAALHREILLQKKKKPIVAFIENSCCAAAYYVASACDLIVASACAEVGDIGVLYPHGYLNSPQYYALEGTGIMQGSWQQDALQAGSYKMAELPMKPMSDGERAMQQNFIDDVYKTVCTDIARARDLDLTTSDLWADGQIFTGKHACSLGLVDIVGSLTDTKTALHELFKERSIKVPGSIVFLEKPQQQWLPTWKTLLEKTLGNQAQTIRGR